MKPKKPEGPPVRIVQEGVDPSKPKRPEGQLIYEREEMLQSTYAEHNKFFDAMRKKHRLELKYCCNCKYYDKIIRTVGNKRIELINNPIEPDFTLCVYLDDNANNNCQYYKNNLWNTIKGWFK
jgi:hypothetical protein